MIAIRCTLALLLVMTLSACGLMIDGVYKLGDGKTSVTVPASAATGQEQVRIEYEGSQPDNQGLQLGCYRRTRNVERGWDVTKHYEYRGGFEKDTYSGAAVMDGVFGTLVAGVLVAVCAREDSTTSCAHVLWATPFAIDLVYSLIRRSTVRPKVLVGKTQGADRMQYGAPAHEEVTQCESVVALFLGRSSGPSDEQLLNGSASGGTRELVEGALQLGFDEAGNVVLTPEVVDFWAERSWANLWVRDDQGDLQPVTLDRCSVLRSQNAIMSSTARQNFQTDCPLPQPAQ